jgi:hypothetical protein
MELREALTEARAANAAAEVARLAAAVEDKAVAARRELTGVFAALQNAASAPDETALATAQQLLGRLRYYRRFHDEVAQFEDEALV